LTHYGLDWRANGGTAMVTLVNKFTVTADPAEFERIWAASSHFMRHQPGFISFRLVRSLQDPQVYINIAEWADAQAHGRALESADFRAHISELANVAKPEPYLCDMVLKYDADR
jgi:long-chain acyl-CoA synthetase